MRVLIYIIIFLFPLMVLGATSENYRLDQEGFGFVEFNSSSNNFGLKATVGSVGKSKSTSANYIINKGRVWAITETSSSGDPGGSGSGTPTPSGGGGGGGGGGAVSSPSGVTFSGRAYPLSRVRLLKDGQIIVSTLAGPDAYFSITALGINAGTHSFVIVGVDNDGLTSQSQPFSIKVSSGATTQIGGILLSPTLAVDKKEVRRGDNLVIFGQTVPESVVTIGVASDEEIFRATSADNNGVFLYNLDTSSLVNGNHETRAKSTKSGAISDFGRTVGFVVGNKNIFNKNTGCVERGDMNDDCRVNLVDFSIAGFWYGKKLSRQMLATESLHLNGDGVISLTDLSIMAFYWTG